MSSLERRRSRFGSGGKSGPRNGVRGAPAWVTPNTLRLTTVGQAATTAPFSDTVWARHRSPATASSHQEVANTEPCGERATSSS